MYIGSERPGLGDISMAYKCHFIMKISKINHFLTICAEPKTTSKMRQNEYNIAETGQQNGKILIMELPEEVQILQHNGNMIQQS